MSLPRRRLRREETDVNMTKAERLIRLLRLLEEGGAVTIEQLSAATGRTERTIWRDLAGLRKMNVPLEITQGRYKLDRRKWNQWGKPTLKLTRKTEEKA